MERKGEKSNPPCTFVPVPKAGRAPSLQAASERLGSERMKRAATQPPSHGHHIYINVNSPAASLYNDFTGLTPFVTYPIHWNERWGLGCELQLTKQIYFTTSFKKLTKKKRKQISASSFTLGKEKYFLSYFHCHPTFESLTSI